MGRACVRVGVGDHFEQVVIEAEDALRRLAQRLDSYLVLRGRVGRRTEQDAGLDRIVRHARVLPDPPQHQAVKGDLEPVLDLRFDGGLHVADQDLEGQPPSGVRFRRTRSTSTAELPAVEVRRRAAPETT